MVDNENYDPKIDAQKDAIEKNFPFTRSDFQSGQNTPQWVINLLWNKNTLEEVSEVIRSFSNQRIYFKEQDAQDDQSEIRKDYPLEQISHLVTDDFDIMQMPKYSVSTHILTSEEEESIFKNNDNESLTNIPMPLTTIFKACVWRQDGKEYKNITIKFKNPEEMTVKEFKSYLLTHTENLPFVLRFDVENDRKVSELIKKQNQYFENNKKLRMPSENKKRPWKDVKVENQFDVIVSHEIFDLILEYDNTLTKFQTENIQKLWQKQGGKRKCEDHDEELQEIKAGFYDDDIKKAKEARENGQIDDEQWKQIEENIKEMTSEKPCPACQKPVSYKEIYYSCRSGCPTKKWCITCVKLPSLSCKNGDKIAYDVTSKIGKFYYSLTGTIIPNRMKQQLQLDANGNLTFQNFSEILTQKCDERLPNVTLRNVTLETTLLDIAIDKNKHVAEAIQIELHKKSRVPPTNYYYPHQDEKDKKATIIEDQILIITEDGKSYPVFRAYDIALTLKDLGINRNSKLKFKVIRTQNNFTEAINSIDYLISENEDEKQKQKARKMKAKLAQEMKNKLKKLGGKSGVFGKLKIGDNEVQNEGGEPIGRPGKIHFDIPNYLKEAFITQSKNNNDHDNVDGEPDVLGEELRTPYTIKINDFEKMTVPQAKDYISKQINSKPIKNGNQETDYECCLDIENFNSPKIGPENLKLIAVFSKEYNPYKGTDSEFANTKPRKEWFMEEDKVLSFYQEILQGNDDSDNSSDAGETLVREQLQIKIELYNVIALQIDDFEKRPVVPKDYCSRGGHKMLLLYKEPYGSSCDICSAGDEELYGDGGYHCEICKSDLCQKCSLGYEFSAKKWKFIKFSADIESFQDLAKFLKEKDIFISKSQSAIKDDVKRDEVMRLNLLFKHEDKFVLDKIESAFKIDQVTSKTSVQIKIRRNCSRKPTLVVKPEEIYLINQMRADIQEASGNPMGLKQELLAVMKEFLENKELFTKTELAENNLEDLRTLKRQQLEAFEKDLSQIIDEGLPQTQKQEIKITDDVSKQRDNFERALKLYSDEPQFRALNNIHLTGQYGSIANQLRQIIDLSNKFGDEMTYQQFDKPIYRGITSDQFKTLDYEPNSIKQWSTFSKCSTSFDKAYRSIYVTGLDLSLQEDKQNLTIFKIFMSKDNKQLVRDKEYQNKQCDKNHQMKFMNTLPYANEWSVYLQRDRNMPKPEIKCTQDHLMKFIKTNPYMESHGVSGADCDKCRQSIKCENGFYNCCVDGCSSDIHKDCAFRDVIQPKQDEKPEKFLEDLNNEEDARKKYESIDESCVKILYNKGKVIESKGAKKLLDLCEKQANSENKFRRDGFGAQCNKCLEGIVCEKGFQNCSQENCKVDYHQKCADQIKSEQMYGKTYEYKKDFKLKDDPNGPYNNPRVDILFTGYMYGGKVVPNTYANLTYTNTSWGWKYYDSGYMNELFQIKGISKRDISKGGKPLYTNIGNYQSNDLNGDGLRKQESGEEWFGTFKNDSLDEDDNNTYLKQIGQDAFTKECEEKLQKMKQETNDDTNKGRIEKVSSEKLIPKAWKLMSTSDVQQNWKACKAFLKDQSMVQLADGRANQLKIYSDIQSCKELLIMYTGIPEDGAYLVNQRFQATNIVLSNTEQPISQLTKYQKELLSSQNSKDHGEKDVLTLPYFNFLVAKVEEIGRTTVAFKNSIGRTITNQGNITTVTLMEVPFQKVSSFYYPDSQVIYNESIIVSDSTNAQRESLLTNMIMKGSQNLQVEGVIYDVMETNYHQFAKKMMESIKLSVRTVLVIQCQYGMKFVEQLYNGLNSPSNIKQILIFADKGSLVYEDDVSNSDRHVVSDREVKALIEHVKNASKNFPGPNIRWENEPLDSSQQDGERVKVEDSFIVNGNEDKEVGDEEKAKKAFDLLRVICAKSRFDTNDLKARLDQEGRENGGGLFDGDNE